MKLLSVSTARSLWFVQVDDLNPRGLDLLPILAAIQARYRFQVYPTKPEDIYTPSDGIKFSKGSFRLDDGQQVEIAKATLYNDGILADTRHSTTVADLFINDLLTFLSQSCRLTFEPQMVQRKVYLSELVVSTDADLETLNKGFCEFSALLADANGEGREFKAISVKFGTDPASPGIALQFSFERRALRPFNENRYFSTAPVGTDKHLELLYAWERIVAG